MISTKDSKFKFILLVVSVLCLLVFSLPSLYLQKQDGHSRGMFDGYYNRGLITIRAYQVDTFSNYEIVAFHEWGHHVYDKYLTKEDLKAWYNAFQKCGVQTDYAKTYKSKSVRMNEEFAELYSNWKTGVLPQACPEKLAVINKYG